MFKLFLVQPAVMGLSLIQLLGDGGGGRGAYLKHFLTKIFYFGFKLG